MQALTASRLEETIIRLPRGGQLATVEDTVNGISVKVERIRVDVLILSLLNMLDEADIRKHFIHSGSKQFSLLEIFGPLIQESTDSKEVQAIFNLFLKRYSREADRDITIELFGLFASHIDLSELHEVGMNEVLKSMLQQIEKMKDSSSYDLLLQTLLKKVGISSLAHHHMDAIYASFLEGIQGTDNLGLLSSMFKALTNRIDEEVILTHLRPYLQDYRASSPILPRNCILYQETMDKSRIVALEVKKQAFNVQFGSSFFTDVGHPKLIFVFKVSANHTVGAHVLTVKDRVITPDTEVFYYPYSNVEYTQGTFAACWPELASLAAGKQLYDNLHLLSSLPYLFLNSPSNNDLYKYENLRDRFSIFEGQSFDEEILEATGITLTQYFNMI